MSRPGCLAYQRFRSSVGSARTGLAQHGLMVFYYTTRFAYLSLSIPKPDAASILAPTTPIVQDGLLDVPAPDVMETVGTIGLSR